MSEWLPIEIYDALPKKPKHAAFAVAGVLPSRGGQGKWRLPPMVTLSRSYGSREVTHWFALPELPQQESTPPSPKAEQG